MAGQADYSRPEAAYNVAGRARYAFSKQFVNQGVAVDMACAFGVGTRLLASESDAFVIGLDVDGEAVTRAQEEYHGFASFGIAAATALPLRSDSVDTFVTLETLEHINYPRDFVAEVARVLKPSGVTVLSTPNRPVNSPFGVRNPYHISEMSMRETADLLAEHFNKIQTYGQCMVSPRDWKYYGHKLSAILPVGFRRPVVSFVRRILRRPDGIHDTAAIDSDDEAVMVPVEDIEHGRPRVSVFVCREPRMR